MEFHIDEGLRKLIPILSDAEQWQLERNLKQDGCRDPLVIWAEKGALLDGHHRYEICRRLQIPFKTETVSLKDRDEAKAWVITNQFGRRNLAPFVRAELALHLEPLIASRAKENQKAGGARAAGNGRVVRQKSDKPVDTKTELARVAGISHDTIHKAKKIAEKAPEPIKEKLRKGETTINAAYKDITRKEKEAARTERDQQRAAALPRDRCCVIHGDFVATLATLDKKADAIITDPPYSFEHLHLYEELAKSASAALKPGGSLLVMTGQSYIPEILALMASHIRYHWMIAYLTPGGQSVQLWQRNVNTFWKPVLWFVNGDYKGKWIGDVAKSAVNDNDKRFHDWGQSETGMVDLIERVTEVGDLIIDPFMGAGTTGLAALALNRQFIGIDKDEKAIEAATTRLKC